MINIRRYIWLTVRVAAPRLARALALAVLGIALDAQLLDAELHEALVQLLNSFELWL